MTAEQLASDTDSVVEFISDLLRRTDGVQRTIIANRLRRAIDEVSPPKAVEQPETIEPMPYEEAMVFRHTPITYGQYCGESWGDIPRQYLDWLVEVKRAEWRQLLRFLKSPLAPERYDDDE